MGWWIFFSLFFFFFLKKKTKNEGYGKHRMGSCTDSDQVGVSAETEQWVLLPFP